MVVSINKDGILAKLRNSALSDTRIQQAAKRAVSMNAYAIAQDMGDKCAKCIETALYECTASAELANAVGDIFSGNPRRMTDGEYAVGIYIEETSRPSLVPGEALVDVAALVNNGYDGVSHRVRGSWHTKEILNKPFLDGAHFVQQGISDFNGNYGYSIGGVYAQAMLDSDRFN